MSSQLFTCPPTSDDEMEDTPETIIEEDDDDDITGQLEGTNEQELLVQTLANLSVTKKTSDKLSASDKKMIQTQVSSLMKTYMSQQTRAFDELLNAVTSAVVTASKTTAPAKSSTKRTPPNKVAVEDISEDFVATYLDSFQKHDISPRDLNAVLNLHAFEDNNLVRTDKNYKALCLTETEIKILKAITDTSSPLNVTKADSKILMAKIVKSKTSFTHRGTVYQFDDKLWEKLCENGHIQAGFNERGVIQNCPVDLGESLKAVVKRTPTFAGKLVTENSFNNFITSVTTRNVDLYFAVPEANAAVLSFLGVPSVVLPRGKLLYTKSSLLKAAFLERINPETKRFDAETENMLTEAFPGSNYEKIKVDELIKRCSFTLASPKKE